MQQCSEIYNDFISQVSSYPEYNAVPPSKMAKINVRLFFVVISIVGVPWDLVFLLDLWLLEHHEDPTEREKKSQNKSLVMPCRRA